MGVQFIKAPDGTEMAVLPREDYEDLVDMRLGQTIADAVERGSEELLDGDEVRALLAAPTPLLFWREKRGLARSSLASTLDLAEVELKEIEAGQRQAPLSVYRRAAEALNVPLDDLAA